MPDVASAAIMRRITTTPRTLLAFMSGAMAIDVVGTVGIVVGLGEAHASTYLIPFVGVAGLLIFLGLVVTTIVLAVKAPHHLQLAPVTAEEYIQIEKLELGDSTTPLRTELVAPTEANRLIAIEGVATEPKASTGDDAEPDAT